MISEYGFSIDDFEVGMKIRWSQDSMGHTATSRVHKVYKSKGLILTSGPMSGAFAISYKSVVSILEWPSNLDESNPNKTFERV